MRRLNPAGGGRKVGQISFFFNKPLGKELGTGHQERH